MPLNCFNIYNNKKDQLYSQWGEEGIIQKILDITKIRGHSCVEFGAADGEFCSNTAFLWKRGWDATLIEANPNLFAILKHNTRDYDNVKTLNLLITDIDLLVPDPVDVMSIDVDGLDLDIFRKMQVKHNVVVIEHNPTIPPTVPFAGGQGAGAGIASIVEEAEAKGYFFLTATLSNTFLVHKKFRSLFNDYNKDVSANFDPGCLNYVITDYHGNYDILGILPYGMERKVDFDVQGIV